MSLDDSKTFTIPAEEAHDPYWVYPLVREGLIFEVRLIEIVSPQ